MDILKRVRSTVSEALGLDFRRRENREKSSSERNDGQPSQQTSTQEEAGKFDDILRKMTSGGTVSLSSGEVDTLLSLLEGVIREEEALNEVDAVENIRHRYGNSIPGKSSHSFIDFLASHYTKSTPLKEDASAKELDRNIRRSSHTFFDDESLAIEVSYPFHLPSKIFLPYL
jgi:hypothetical protein